MQGSLSQGHLGKTQGKVAMPDEVVQPSDQETSSVKCFRHLMEASGQSQDMLEKSLGWLCVYWNYFILASK